MHEYIVTVMVTYQLNSKCMFPDGSKLSTEMEDWGKSNHTQGVTHMLSFKQQQAEFLRGDLILSKSFVLHVNNKELTEDAVGQSSLSAWGDED